MNTADFFAQSFSLLNEESVNYDDTIERVEDLIDAGNDCLSTEPNFEERLRVESRLVLLETYRRECLRW